MLAVRFGDAAALALDNAHVRAESRAAGADRSADGALEPPGLPRAAPQRGRPRLVRARVRRAPDARPRRLQAGQRHLRARGRRPGAGRARGRAPGGRAPERRRLPDRWRGVRDHRSLGRPRRSRSRLAERVAERVALAEFYPAGPMTLSIGIALGPDHAANPRELVACAELAMMTAKARGKSRIVVFHEDESERPESPTARGERHPLDRPPEDAARRLEQAQPPARGRRDRGSRSPTSSGS